MWVRGPRSPRSLPNTFPYYLFSSLCIAASPFSFFRRFSLLFYFALLSKLAYACTMPPVVACQNPLPIYIFAARGIKNNLVVQENDFQFKIRMLIFFTYAFFMIVGCFRQSLTMYEG